MLKKKGQISIPMMVTAALALVALVVATGFGISVLSDQKADVYCTNTSAPYAVTLTYNATTGDCQNSSSPDGHFDLSPEALAYDDGIGGTGKFPDKSGLIASIVIMVFVIGLLLTLGRQR